MLLIKVKSSTRFSSHSPNPAKRRKSIKRRIEKTVKDESATWTSTPTRMLNFTINGSCPVGLWFQNYNRRADS
ncbi:hypothetical protein Y032_0014g2385 [Ancylostoma ceylanicum]|uniref:Uncharacterized protein n=1 Tax=Ancylostoma ceylanicum TaxID=53326 RepID=A0A016VBW2_9BILA|nr:hypothetical protein Y032_0014g2385 [Ancylostoma ceylanicum]